MLVRVMGRVNFNTYYGKGYFSKCCFDILLFLLGLGDVGGGGIVGVIPSDKEPTYSSRARLFQH